HHVDIISGERRDVLRLGEAGFKLARREVIIDQAVLGTPNLAIFL
ncbi:aromatic-ring-hydroxylating dioxygenase subunit beta, partial [Pseudomonas gessardii]|nr:aromatic-ring-hydroxylating dioxygenase subunit beta [Pseudomonas gessardii]